MSTKPKVIVNLGYTINVGNFNSVRIDIGVEDYAREDENVDAAFNRIYNYVEKKLIEKANEAKEEM